MNNKDIHELGKLLDSDPSKVLEILRNDPKLRDEILAWAAERKVGEVPSVDNFKKIYQSFFGRELPRIHEQVAEEFVYALKNRTGVLFESWRGGGKSTFFFAWCPSVMGWNPVGSTLLMRVNTQKAQEMGKAIATLIMTNEGWKKHFGHVVPDEKAGWSVENGFNVMDTRITGKVGGPKFEENYAKWRMACMADHLSEQSLLCVGIESGMGIGSHSTNGAWFDDLHDEGNTSSPAELKKITNLVEGNIIPSWISIGKAPTLGVFCTPWSENPPDAYQVFLRTGMFKHVKLPLFAPSDDGEVVPDKTEDGYAIGEWAGRKVKLTWPERFDMGQVTKMMRVYGTRFGQMCLCDVSLSRPKNMRYQGFEAEAVKWGDWPMVLGVDPVAAVSAEKGMSYFAAAQLLLTPYNTVIVADGVVEKMGAEKGEEYIAETQRTFYKTYRNASIESNGAGAVFISTLTRTKGLRVHSHTVGEVGQGDKRTRQYRFLQPLFASGAVLVSKADTPFLNAVREYLDTFPNFEKGSYLEDVGDALAIGLLDIPQIWTKIVTGSVDAMSSVFERKPNSVSPWSSLGQGYRR